MAIQYSDALRNAMLDAIETELTTTGTCFIEIRKDPKPTGCDDVDDGATGLLATCNMTANDPFAAASAQAVSANAISDSGAATAGTCTYFRLKKSGATTTCTIQGTCGAAADLDLGTSTIGSGAIISITAFTITEGNP